MNRNYFFIVVALALACLLLIFFSLGREIETPINKEPANPPPVAPFESYISGVGIVEASSGNIFIGTELNRIVDKILVHVGDRVNKGDLLFKLRDSDLQVNLLLQQIALKKAAAELERLKELPRSEDLQAADAILKSAQVELEQAKNQYEMVQKLPNPRAISGEEQRRRFFQYQLAQTKWNQAEADYKKIKAGPWQPDLEIKEIEVQQAQAAVTRIKKQILQTIIQAPIEGVILQIKIHEGELPFGDHIRAPLMVMGNTDELYLRVSIDQLDISFFNPNSPAAAFLQGDSTIKYPLKFVRVEPYLVDKQNLTNELTETVDTRVLQIIYSINQDDHPLYIGQQMDVFIKAKFPERTPE